MEVVTYYATANRRAPFVALYGHWPATSGLTKACMSGVRLVRRAMTEAEREQLDDRATMWRFYAERWPDLLTMLRAHRDYDYGDEQFPRALMAAVRTHREAIKRVLEVGKKKETKHRQKRAKRQLDTVVVA